jgi:hypothetical protein
VFEKNSHPAKSNVRNKRKYLKRNTNLME